MTPHSASPRPRGGKWPPALAWLALLLLAVAALMVIGAGPAYRQGLLPLGEAFHLLRNGIFVALGAGAVGLATLITAAACRRRIAALTGVVVMAASIGMMAVPWLHWQQAQQAPPIHDITTDTENPPAFEALAEAREAAPNAVAYPGEATARQQREAYPEIQPLVLDLPLDSVLSAAEAAALDQGWTLASVTDTTIEATATTTWFGFQDDVVIRLTETAEGVRVDVRSASRVGRSDMGANAARIVAYQDALAARVE
ncbi:DUF1499 domain-containing protein [Halomonas campisalis]|uniref:DUF1499 domain-containing protein n=1 Tax=Billgrantia campisalis TaxID=74661 RepID=A0ABS9P9N5_9GAMM|nr:DUF1499 domain-containing protein [Halomonas campisalis]MCG6658465.1 DUF1499 domain-containing protein [Halomonas campisalis]MDR5863325.1 DUF1499 domain-containing protein [Halomonas campisalis]